MGVLKDGTPFRRFAPPLPLDERWRLPNVADMMEIRERWVNLRASLMQSGQLDGAARKLLGHWSEHFMIPRPIDAEGGDHVSLLLQAGIDSASIAGAKTNFQLRDALPAEAARRQAAEILARSIRQNDELAPMEIAKVHGLVCPDAAPKDKEGQRIEGMAGVREGAFRSKPMYVMGTDWVMKEGAPPRQVVPELLKLIEANRAARQRGERVMVRAAWVMYALGVVHPFYDGNGKLARIVASAVLVRGGRLPFLMPPHVHPDYFDCISQARNGNPERLIRLVFECQVVVMESALRALT